MKFINSVGKLNQLTMENKGDELVGNFGGSSLGQSLDTKSYVHSGVIIKSWTKVLLILKA